MPWRADVLVFPTEASDAEMFAEIDTIAELIGSDASDADSPRGHYSGFATSGRCSTAPRDPSQHPRQREGRIAMLIDLILGSVALMGRAFAGDCSWSSSAYAEAIAASA